MDLEALVREYDALDVKLKHRERMLAQIQNHLVLAGPTPPRCASPPVASTSTVPPPTSRILTSNVPPPRA